MTHTEERASGSTVRALRENPRARAAALVAVGAVVGLVLWLVVEAVRGDGSKDGTPTTQNKPVALSASGLATRIDAGGQTVYWVGERPGVTYELSRTANLTFVRYLPTGFAAGDKRRSLTVGTYDVPNAYQATVRMRNRGAEIVHIPGGGVAAVSRTSPTSVYVAFRDGDYLLEIYDPDPGKARALAASGAVRRVPGPEAVSTARGPEMATAGELRAFARSLGHPVYWAGPQPGTTYELAKNEEGAVYIRYLPKGRGGNATQGVLTIVTYPVENGFAVTKRGSKAKRTFMRKLDSGAVVIYAQDNPYNVYLGFPGEDVQVEVYSPSPVKPVGLALRGKIVPVG